MTSTYPDWNGWAIDPQESRQQTAVFETAADIDFQAAGGLVEFRLIQDFLHGGTYAGQENHQIGRFRLSYTTADRSEFADGLATGGLLGPDAIWTVLDPTSYAGFFRDGTADPGMTMTELADNSILVGGNNHRGSYSVVAALNATAVTGFRLDVLPHSSLPKTGPGREDLNGNFVLTEFQVSTVPEPSTLLGALLLLVPFGVQAVRSRSK